MFDANLNRAREAVRLCEDWSRFALNDGSISADLKTLRHDLAAATMFHAEHALPHRDTPGDVGTVNTTPAETSRTGLAHAVRAAGKRFGEAARVVEETLKTVAPEQAALVEQIRYRFYDLERRIALTLSPRDRFAKVRLYVILTQAVCNADWLTTAKACIEGGVDAIQLREPNLPAGELLERANTLVPLCRAAGVLCIINDRPDVAVLSGADGVHVGQTDLPCAAARRIVGPDRIVGVSTHEVSQVEAAHASGATYVGVGPVFSSTTKPRDITPGLAFAKAAAEIDLLPTIAIAGITPENVAEVWSTGVTGSAVASAVTRADDPVEACRHFKRSAAPA